LRISRKGNHGHLPTIHNATQLVREDDIADMIVCEPDPAKHIEKIQAFAKAGYDHVYVHQVGPDQEGFFQFYQQEILPKFR
jgi:coenzyme F420-dependent glucose-6-phosphate dehydrogenase